VSRRHHSAESVRRAPLVPQGEPETQTVDGHTYPACWHKGQLLNVRNAGSHYNLTLEGEEYDTRYPHRCLQFVNPNDCQNFVSWWYAPAVGGRPFGG